MSQSPVNLTLPVLEAIDVQPAVREALIDHPVDEASEIAEFRAKLPLRPLFFHPINPKGPTFTYNSLLTLHNVIQGRPYSPTPKAHPQARYVV